MTEATHRSLDGGRLRRNATRRVGGAGEERFDLDSQEYIPPRTPPTTTTTRSASAPSVSILRSERWARVAHLWSVELKSDKVVVAQLVERHQTVNFPLSHAMLPRVNRPGFDPWRPHFLP